MASKSGPDGWRDGGMEGWVFAQNSAERAHPRDNRHHGVEVATADLLIVGGYDDVTEACVFKNASHTLGAGESKRPRRLRIVSDLS